jgi:hypothetical protein
MTKSNITEGLVNDEMKGLVLSIISIDQFEPKVGSEEETVVVAFSVNNNEQAAKDLSNFLETGTVELLDVDVSPAPDEKSHYKVFVEFSRNDELYEKTAAMLADVDKLIGRTTDWQYTAYKLPEPRKFDQERFERDVTTSPEEYTAKYKKTEADEIAERMKFMIGY